MKKDQMDRDTDRWIAPTMRRSSAAPPGECADAETLAAWAGGHLPPAQMAAVERHAASCSRCLAVLAALERSAPPAASAAPGWTPARLLRWAAPLAAATAVAIWAVVPDRPVAPERPAAVPEQSLAMPEQRAAVQEEPNPAPRTLNPNPAPSTPNPEPPQPSLRRERDAAEAFSAPAEKSAQALPPAAAPPVSPQASDQAAGGPAAKRETAPAAPPPASRTLGAAADAAAPSALERQNEPMRADSSAPANPRIRWRIREGTIVERSTDAGATWLAVRAPAGTGSRAGDARLVSVRAVDDRRAVVRTSDGRELYTADAGATWTALQENQPAPF